jgi:type 1 glutamine amidotransferase
MLRKISVLATSLAALGASAVAHAAPRPVTDCPLRNAPFSAASPVIDILLSEPAKAVVEAVVPGRLSKLPPTFMGTSAPSFAALMDINALAGMLRISDEQVAEIDRRLRAVPVTAADKVARCARYDNEQPLLTVAKGKKNILFFDKINGFYHAEAVPAAREAIQQLAARKGWSVAFTNKGGSITPATLRKFDAVVWSNVSGDVLTLSQRKALENYVNGGGGFVAFHGSGGDSYYSWPWYADMLIGARFIGHPMAPQFQEARVVTDNPAHPAADGLPAEWRMTDEWYSFKTSPRLSGANVVLTLDESTYKPVGMANQDLRMGDHPIAWSRCVGRGRAFYSAIGHKAESYSQPQNVRLMDNALEWAANRKAVCPRRP